MRGPIMTGSGNQDRRDPPFKGKGKGKGKKKGKKGKRPPFGKGGPLHEAMVNAAT